jgi:hypothetical protein
MPENTFLIRFPDETPDVGNAFAEELKQELLEADQTVRVERRREAGTAQDFGATLVLILGTGAITAIAKGISSWIARNSGVRVEIQNHDGRVIVDHLDSKDAQQVVASVFARSAN